MIGLEPQEYQALLRSVGTHRGERVLSPLEVSRLLKKAMTAGATRKQCADSLHLGQTLVGNFLKLLELDPDIRHLVDWGNSTGATISFSSMVVLARLRRADQIQAADAILRYQLTSSEVVQLVQISERSPKILGQCIDGILDLRPKIEIRHLFAGAVNSENLRQHLATLSQEKRNQLFDSVMATLLDSKGLISGRLGETNFTILSSLDFPTRLGLDPDELEKAINETLDRERTLQ